MPRDPGTVKDISLSMESLKRRRTGHISTVTRLENAVRDILSKNVTSPSSSDVSKVRYAQSKCMEQSEKVADLNQQIQDSMTEAETQPSDEVLEEEAAKVDANDFKIKSFLLTLEDLLLEYETHRAASLTMSNSSTETQMTSQGSSGLKLPKLSLPTFSG